MGIGVALVVARVGHGRAHRALVALLLLDGVGQAGWTLADLRNGDAPSVKLGVAVGVLCFAATVLPYLLLVRTLPTPLARRLRDGRVSLVLGLAAVALATPFILWAVRVGGAPLLGSDAPVIPTSAALGLAIPIALTYVFAFFASLSAYRLAEPGSVARRRAGAYALAFGMRDALYLLAIVANLIIVEALAHPELFDYVYPLWSLATLVYVPILAYGILRLQLFDIDVKVKIGIQRGTIATFALASVFVVSKVVEAYVSREFGFVAGAVAAGLLLFLAPRLNKMGDRVANAAMPRVQPTEGYLLFKKLEVYKAAVESAFENDHRIDAPERAMLDRLRAKLELQPDDAAHVEAEVAERTGSARLADASST